MNGKRLLKEKDKKKLPPIGKLQKKCDARMQEINKILNKQCLICRKPTQVAHHFFPKSVSSALRYNWANLIPLCNGCHWRLHGSGDPSYELEIIKQKGLKWLNDLTAHKHDSIKVNREYYLGVMEKLENHLIRCS